ncbi:MAG: tetratricopeptide repeat protein [Chloroflexota bacterium]|jgi:tetratricopeptide (TPR) repeat protein
MSNQNDPNTHYDEADIPSLIEKARDLRRVDELEDSQQLLLDLLKEFPEHPLILFEVGGSYDVLGEEEMAIPYYREAVENGLTGEDRHECLICLGSSLRVMGEDEEAIEVLESAVDEFPHHNSARVFLALAYYSNDQPDQAISELLALLLETTADEDILAYADVLEYYKDNLDEEMGE